jgi:hypothetical protein
MACISFVKRAEIIRLKNWMSLRGWRKLPSSKALHIESENNDTEG